MAHSELFMVSPINAILEGLYETPMTIAELRQHGDFGIGTFNDLDGELILLDGIVYQLDVNGVARKVGESEKTPFAAACFFNPFSVEEIGPLPDYHKFIDFLNLCLPSPNMVYAIRIEGDFSQIHTRSVPKTKNHTPLVEATALQQELQFNGIKGSLVGFYTPDFMPSVNVPGYHFHFIDKDFRQGGHLLGCKIKNARLSIHICNRLIVNLPMTLDYLGVNFNRDARKDLEKAEK